MAVDELNFVKLAIQNKGSIHPLIIPSNEIKGPALTNPSIYLDGDKLLVNLRNINYTLYHVRWNDKLYTTGVRRDLDTIGTGRMELSEIEFAESGVKEVNQHRIPSPPPDQEYCNKNWMPILDMPYHYVKWTNGTEIVKYDIETNTTETVIKKDWIDLGTIDLRGGSQIIPLGDNYRFCLTHETYLTKSDAGRKDGVYRHRFVVWDKDWNIVKISRQFSFMNAEIEFAVGMVEYKGDYLITFGYQDNAAYLVRVPKSFVEEFVFK